MRAKNLALIAGQVPAVAEAYLNMGNTFRKLNQFDSSYNCFSTALSYFIQLKNQPKIARTYSGIAALNFKEKDYDKSNSIYKTK